jgi:hypothetical protein
VATSLQARDQARAKLRLYAVPRTRRTGVEQLDDPYSRATSRRKSPGTPAPLLPPDMTELVVAGSRPRAGLQVMIYVPDQKGLARICSFFEHHYDIFEVKI